MNQAEEKKEFDLRVHIRDPKTGATLKTQPYRLHISRENGTRYERAGVYYFANGDKIPGQAPLVSPKVEKVVDPEIENLKMALAASQAEAKAAQAMLEEVTKPAPEPVATVTKQAVLGAPYEKVKA